MRVESLSNLTVHDSSNTTLHVRFPIHPLAHYRSVPFPFGSVRDRRARTDGRRETIHTNASSSYSSRAVDRFIRSIDRLKSKLKFRSVDRSIRVDGANRCIGLDETKPRTIRTDGRWRFGEVVNGNPRQRYVTTGSDAMRCDAMRARGRREGCDDEGCDRVVSISFEKMDLDLDLD